MSTTQAEDMDIEALLDNLIEVAKLVQRCQHSVDYDDGYYKMNLKELEEVEDTLRELREQALVAFRRNG